MEETRNYDKCDVCECDVTWQRNLVRVEPVVTADGQPCWRAVTAGTCDLGHEQSQVITYPRGVCFA